MSVGSDEGKSTSWSLSFSTSATTPTTTPTTVTTTIVLLQQQQQQQQQQNRYVLSPKEYLRKPWHVIDGTFIAVSLVLELHELTVHEDDLHPASPFVSLSIRVWRILRIVHAFTVALELEYQEAQNAAELEERLRDMMQRVSNLESELCVVWVGGIGGGLCVCARSCKHAARQVDS